jgi:hypothetical protein
MTEVLMSLGAIAGLALLLTMALVPLFVDVQARRERADVPTDVPTEIPAQRRPSDPSVPVATQRQAVGSPG